MFIIIIQILKVTLKYIYQIIILWLLLIKNNFYIILPNNTIMGAFGRQIGFSFPEIILLGILSSETTFWHMFFKAFGRWIEFSRMFCIFSKISLMASGGGWQWRLREIDRRIEFSKIFYIFSKIPLMASSSGWQWVAIWII